jgi:hypothetical protein
MTAVSDEQKLLSLCSDYATGCTAEKVRIDFRQMQASVSFATANSSVVGSTELSVHWMPWSSSSVVNHNIMIRNIKSQKTKYMCKRITVLKQLELLREFWLEIFY